MHPILTQEGGLLLWRYILQLLPPLPFKLHLLGQAVQPLHTWVEADFAAHELSVTGYAPYSLSNPAANWSFAPDPNGQQALNQAPMWTFAGACTVYGWWLSDSTSAVSVAGNQWQDGYPFGPAGGSFFVSLNPSLVSGICPDGLTGDFTGPGFFP